MDSFSQIGGQFGAVVCLDLAAISQVYQYHVDRIRAGAGHDANVELGHV
jgi:hypothetical protein